MTFVNSVFDDSKLRHPSNSINPSSIDVHVNVNGTGSGSGSGNGSITALMRMDSESIHINFLNINKKLHIFYLKIYIN